MKSNLYLGMGVLRGHRDGDWVHEYCDERRRPNTGIVCDASCVAFRGSIQRDGYFHGKVEYQCRDVVTKEVLHKSKVYPQSTINIGEFMAIMCSLMILHERGDEKSPVWSDSRLCIGWVKDGRTSTRLPMNEFTWEALDEMEEMAQWLKKTKPKNPLIWWDKDLFGPNPADYGRK